MRKTVETFGGIDILVNNASAISLTGTVETPMKRYDLMHGDQHARHVRVLAGVHSASQEGRRNPHILNISPPLNMEARWFAPHVAYTMAKFGMSMCVLGMAGGARGDGIAVNALWPRTVIATAAVQNLLGGDEAMRGSRKPEIMADAAHAILTKPSREFTGQLLHRRGGAAEGGRHRLRPLPVDARGGAHPGLLPLTVPAFRPARRALARYSRHSERQLSTSERELALRTQRLAHSNFSCDSRCNAP